MTTRRLILSACVLCALSTTLVATSPANAEPMDPPTAPCNMANRMNVEIVDGIFWECQCFVLSSGFACDWYAVAGVAPEKTSRRHRIKKHAHRRLVIRYALPMVTR